MDERTEKRLREACASLKRRSDTGEWMSDTVFYGDLEMALEELDRLRLEVKELRAVTLSTLPA
jgi:hypothetical protein